MNNNFFGIPDDVFQTIDSKYLNEFSDTLALFGAAIKIREIEKNEQIKENVKKKKSGLAKLKAYNKNLSDFLETNVWKNKVDLKKCTDGELEELRKNFKIAEDRCRRDNYGTKEEQECYEERRSLIQKVNERITDEIEKRKLFFDKRKLLFLFNE